MLGKLQMRSFCFHLFFVFQIVETDQFPKIICITCLAKLCEIYAFRQAILRADAELRHLHDLRMLDDEHYVTLSSDANELHSANWQIEENGKRQSSPALPQTKGRNKIASKMKNHCIICDKDFMGNYRFEKHLTRKHTVRNDVNVLKPFECGICDKAYTTMANLNIHKVTHSGEFETVNCRSQIIYI